VAFRFAFVYAALYFFPLSATMAGSFGWLWQSSSLVPRYETLWHRIVPWVGSRLLDLRHPIDVNAWSADSKYYNVRSLCYALIAVVVAALWSGLDRNRLEYSKLDGWLRWYVRIVLGSAMFLYGADKIIPVQMWSPGLTTLIQPTGDLTPHRLLWSVMGASKTYQMFAGAAETLGGVLLLFPPTVTLGALVSAGALTNVFLLDLFYDIPVKLWALHLLGLAVWLILPNVGRLTRALVSNRPAPPEPRRPLFRRRWLDFAALAAQWALSIPVLVLALSEGRSLLRRDQDRAAGNPLYGIWRVAEFVLDGQTRPPLLTDSLRWQRVIFDSAPYMSGVIMVMTEEMSGQLSPYPATIDPRTNTLSWKTPRTANLAGPNAMFFSAWTTMHPDAPDGTTELTYRRSQPDSVILEGLLNGHRLRVTLKKEDRRFELTSRRFSWINDEYDLFNDRALR
jgi:hypothetical protein